MNIAAPAERGTRFRVQVSDNHEALCRLAAEHFVQTVLNAVSAADRATVALSGGSTPRGLYALLATEPYRVRVPWEKVHVFWGDERCVPPDDAQSNYKMAHDALLAHVSILPENIHRMRGEAADLDAAARDYEEEICAALGSASATPSFDLIHLGMGDDGHTASLFPHTQALCEGERMVASNAVEKLATHRLTFTYPLLNAAAQVVFLACGDGKAAVLEKVLEGPYEPSQYPSQGVQPAQGTTLWLLDKTAAACLSPQTLARR